MTLRTGNKLLWLTAAAMSCLALLITAADRTLGLMPVRMQLHDLLSPSRLILLSLNSNGGQPESAARSQEFSAADTVRLQTALRDSERQRRQLIIDNARLRNDLRTQKIISLSDQRLTPYGSPRSNRLAEFSVLSATVIGSDGLPGPLKQSLIDAGAALGVTRSELVVDGTGILLDQGSEEDVSAGDRVLAGSVVVGRIEKVGRWVSLVQSVTDRQFSAGVQLLRNSADEIHFGATGILKGTGEHECLIEGIPYTEPVSVGDDVVTSNIEGLRGPQLYIGEVVRAEFLEGGQWLIRVRPALTFQQVERVGIVRLRLKETAVAP